MANARYQVIELYDPSEPSLPRYVAAQRQDEEAWRVVWERRDRLPGKLAGWFRELSAKGRKPAERVLLGRGAGLTARTAFALARFRVAEINRMATGDATEMADFLCVEPLCRGGRGYCRPIVVVGPDGEQREYPSVSALARAEHIAQPTAVQWVRRGLLGRRGRRAL